MTTKKLLLALLLSTLLAACAPKPAGSEFVGKWKETKGGDTVEFAKNGESFVFIDGDKKYPATLTKDNTLQFSAPKLGTVVFTYSKDSDTIAALGDEFKRVK